MDSSVGDYTFIKRLEALPFVQQIWLFGSRARGDYQERSDIDLAILCSDFGDGAWSEVTKIVDNADTLLDIDCVQFDQGIIGDELYQNILKDGRVIYMKEIAWRDRFERLGNALGRLKEVMEHPSFDQNDFMRDAAIQRFEFTIELFWKLLKKVLLHEKIEATTPRDTLSKAYQFDLIDAEKTWLSMLDDRNSISHAYKEAEAKRIVENIKIYLPVFEKTYLRLKQRYSL